MSSNPLLTVAAKDVYRTIRRAWQAFLKEAGFRRGEGPLSWRLETDGDQLPIVDPQIDSLLFRDRTWRGPGPVEPYASPIVVIEVGCGPSPWDPYYGSGFSVTFWPAVAHLYEHLTREKRRELYVIQNEVISALPSPPRSAYADLSPRVREWYLSNFEAESEPDHPNKQVWMRYHALEHVRRWADFLLPELPAVLDRHCRARRNWLRWRACPNCGSLGQPVREGVLPKADLDQFVCPGCGLTFKSRRELTADETAGFVEYDVS